MEWKKCRTFLPVLPWRGRLPKATAVKHPAEYRYFRSLLTSSYIDNIVEQTSVYVLLCDPSKPLKVTAEDIEQFIGICFYMSIFGLPECTGSQQLG